MSGDGHRGVRVRRCGSAWAETLRAASLESCSGPEGPWETKQEWLCMGEENGGGYMYIQRGGGFLLSRSYRSCRFLTGKAACPDHGIRK